VRVHECLDRNDSIKKKKSLRVTFVLSSCPSFSNYLVEEEFIKTCTKGVA
jgi:hypothetical protein